MCIVTLPVLISSVRALNVFFFAYDKAYLVLAQIFNSQSRAPTNNIKNDIPHPISKSNISVQPKEASNTLYVRVAESVGEKDIAEP